MAEEAVIGVNDSYLCLRKLPLIQEADEKSWVISLKEKNKCWSSAADLKMSDWKKEATFKTDFSMVFHDSAGHLDNHLFTVLSSMVGIPSKVLQFSDPWKYNMCCAFSSLCARLYRVKLLDPTRCIYTLHHPTWTGDQSAKHWFSPARILRSPHSRRSEIFQNTDELSQSTQTLSESTGLEIRRWYCDEHFCELLWLRTQKFWYM